MDSCPWFRNPQSCIILVIIGCQGGARQVYEVTYSLGPVNTLGWQGGTRASCGSLECWGIHSIDY